MKTKILSQRRNDLLKRREFAFEIAHEKGGSPTRLEVREQLAALSNANLECVYVRRMETKTGTTITAGEANVYDSAEEARYTEPDYILSRNAPEEKSQEG